MVVSASLWICRPGAHVWTRRFGTDGNSHISTAERCDCGQQQWQQHDPQSAALQMALQPNLNSLDELLAAIRALQVQADQEMTRVLAQNAELLAALKRIAFSTFGEADASNGEVLEAITWVARDAIAKAEGKPNTRTDDDVADDARAIREEAGR